MGVFLAKLFAESKHLLRVWDPSPSPVVRCSGKPPVGYRNRAHYQSEARRHDGAP